MGKLILVRHGQTDMNVEGIYFGWLDPALNEKGREQGERAKEVLRKISYDNIYSSDLKRASETARLVNYLNRELVLDKRLRELNFGIFEGLSYEEIKSKYPEECKESEKDWQNFNFITGENPKDLQKRAVEFVESLDLEKNNLVVTHWGVINCILSWYFSNGIESYWKYSVENGGICIIESVDRFPILKGLNIG